ncbi:MAG: hypothetical protein ACYTDX_11435 [Planctomycetota bacterium]|jgi:hypothetical protein
MITLIGGVSGTDIVLMIALTLAVVLELTAWGLWVSCRTKKLATAGVLAYLLPSLRWCALAFGAIMVVAPGAPLKPPDQSGLITTVGWTVMETTPFPAVARMADKRDFNRAIGWSYRPRSRRLAPWLRNGPTPLTAVATPPAYLDYPALVYLLASLLLSAGLIYSSGRRLVNEAEPRGGLFARWGEKLRRRIRPPGSGNPMAWKESRLLNTAASRPLYYTVLSLFAAGEIGYVIFIATSGGWDNEEAHYTLVAGYTTLLSLVALIGGAAGMAHERAAGTFDLLRVSLLTPRQFLHGKVTGLVRGMGFLLLFPVVHLAFAAVEQREVNAALAVSALLLIQAPLFWGSVGIACGIRTLRVASAVTWATSLFGAMLVVVPFISVMMHELGGGLRDTGQFLIGLCPPARVWLVHEAMERTHLNDEREGAVFFTLALTAITLILPWLLPAYLERRLRRESEGLS